MQRKALAILLALALTGSAAFAARIQPNPKFRAVNPTTGDPLVGGKLYSYEAGTATPKATYTDQTGAVANANPVELDGNGEASIWLGSGAYKLVLADSADVVIWTLDQIQADDAGSFTTLTATGNATFATISASGVITSTVGGGTAPLVVASNTKVANLNADLLDGKQWDAPDPIGATTPAAGSFTTLSASSTLSATGAATLSSTLAVTGNITGSANSIQQTANGGQWIHGQISEEITLSTAGTTTDSAADLLPANSIIEAVVARVTQTITTATDWKLGDATQAARFLAATTDLTAGTTKVGLAHRQPDVVAALGPVQSAAAKLRITTAGTPGAGKIRLTVFYSQFVPPTS